jgi:hypothetical protein
MTPVQSDKIFRALEGFTGWLDRYGETSYDHQSYYAGPIGRRAKGLYYRHPQIGILAVGPMVFSEAFLPAARRLFWKRMRFPIADAHYAMGFALLFQVTGQPGCYRRAVAFLDSLVKTRSPGYGNYCWGYPFDWVTQKGVFPRDTPMITTTPYAYEAFDTVHSIDGNCAWLDIMNSIAEHAMDDIGDFPLTPQSASSGYYPGDPIGGVVNASAYRAALLADASVRFREPRYWQRAERFVRFVLDAQQPDGSWPYEAGGTRDFVDHFHTCFVLKALAKIEKATSHHGCRLAIDKGVGFYLGALFDTDGMPKPFSKAPRLTLYRNELYDCAEAVNIGVLLRGRFPELDRTTDRVVQVLLDRWQKKDGSFRSRKLLLGWDNVPMHRWGQSQVFRSLGLYLRSLSPGEGRSGQG